MSITQKHWYSAVIAAFSLHALAALPLLLAEPARVEIQPGQGDGIEVGLGGDFEDGNGVEEGDGSQDSTAKPVVEETVAVAEPAPPEEPAQQTVPEPVPEPVQEVIQEPVVEEVAVAAVEQAAAVDANVVEKPAAPSVEAAQAVATLAQAQSPVPASDAQAMPVVASHKAHPSRGKGRRGGKGGKGGNGLKGYFHDIASRIDRHKEYPDEVKKQKFEGKVTVAFVIGRSGDLLSASVRKGSGNKLLDQAALDTLARSAPFPPLPDSLKRDSLKISVPIDYTLINN